MSSPTDLVATPNGAEQIDLVWTPDVNAILQFVQRRLFVDGIDTGPPAILASSSELSSTSDFSSGG